MAKFLVTVHEETDRVYEVEAADEDAAYALDPMEVTYGELYADHGGDISISDVRPLGDGKEA